MRKSSVTLPFYLPVTDAREVEALLQELPIAVDKQHFHRFVLGFPRKYLVTTPRHDIVKHYLLMESLGEKPVISSLSREGAHWKLCLVTRDRSFLFSRLTGTLSCFGMNIVWAEAFANADFLVLDTFAFRDSENYFERGTHRQEFQHLLEDIVEGKKDLEPLLKKRWEQVRLPQDAHFSVELDDQVHPSTTQLTLDCPDHFGLLYLVSRCISEMGCNIEMAYIETPGNRAHDQFYLTCQGKKLPAALQEELKNKLTHLGETFFRQD